MRNDTVRVEIAGPDAVSRDADWSVSIRIQFSTKAPSIFERLYVHKVCARIFEEINRPDNRFYWSVMSSSCWNGASRAIIIIIIIPCELNSWSRPAQLSWDAADRSVSIRIQPLYAPSIFERLFMRSICRSFAAQQARTTDLADRSCRHHAGKTRSMQSWEIIPCELNSWSRTAQPVGMLTEASAFESSSGAQGLSIFEIWLIRLCA